MASLPEVPGADPSSNVLDAIRISAAAQISKSLSVDLETVFHGVEVARKGPHDFTVAIPRLRLKGRPDEYAQKAAQEFVPDVYVEKVIAAGAFLSIFARTSTLIREVLHKVYSMPRSQPGSEYGTNSLGKGKKVIVEFSSPNIAKPFHAGHMRSTIIGTFLSNLYQANGWEVVRLNYLGDWGTQYGLLALGFEKYGSEEALEKDPILHLFEVYVSINNDVKTEELENKYDTKDKAKDYFNRLEQGDESVTAIWSRFRALSIDEYIRIYHRLNVAFDVYGGESLVSPESIRKAMKQLQEQSLLTGKARDEAASQPWRIKKNEKKDDVNDQEAGDDGGEEKSLPSNGRLALAVDLDQWNLGKPVLQKPDGSTMYMVRDIAGAIERWNKYHFDKMIYVVGDQQDLHFAQCFKILSLMNAPFADRLEHVNFGRVNGMKTRTGDVVFLKDILDVAKDKMMTQMEASPERFAAIEDPEFTSDQIGMTAVKIQDMQAKRIMSYDFDWKRMTSFEGDTGPYLQYAHVRLCSIERKVAPEIVLHPSLDEINTDLLTEPKAREIAFHLATFPDVVKAALRTYEPSNIVHYCFKLAHLISSAWETLVVKGQKAELAQARLLLYTCARDVLGNAMRMLSLIPLERM